LYLFLLRCSISEVLWFLSLYFLFLKCSIRPCFCVFIPAQYFYTCWTTTNEIWNLFFISSQLVPQNSFITLCWAKLFSNYFVKYCFATSHHSSYSTSKSFILFFILIKVQY
jgi:hypothetical protein